MSALCAGRVIAHAVGRNNNVQIHSQDGRLLSTLEGHTDRVNAITSIPGADLIATASNDKTAKLWNYKTGECVYTLEGHTNWVRAITSIPGADMIATASWDETAKLWNCKTGECVYTNVAE